MSNVVFINKGQPEALLREAIDDQPETLVMAYRTKDGMFRCVADGVEQPGARLIKLGLAAQLLHDLGAS